MIETLSFPHGTRFLVTGGAGFIGSNLVEAVLRLGQTVRVLDDFSTGRVENLRHLRERYSFEVIEGTITDPKTCIQACDGVDYVLHQAAWGSVPRSIKMPLEYGHVNIQGTLNMLQASAQSGVRKFVWASSSSVYGDEPNLPKFEGREGRLLSPYAVTKKTNELHARLYYDVYGLHTVGLRYFNVFGPGQNPYSEYAAVIPVFVRELLLGRAPTINGDGTQSRDFTYIQNAVQANLKACLAGSEASGEVFNIACGSTCTLNDLFLHITQLLGVAVSPKYGPPRPGDIKHSFADISKAQTLLSYHPTHTLLAGLEETMPYYIATLGSK